MLKYPGKVNKVSNTCTLRGSCLDKNIIYINGGVLLCSECGTVNNNESKELTGAQLMLIETELGKLSRTGCKFGGECLEKDIVDDIKEGVRVCTECGLVINDRLITDDKEWRQFEGGEGAEKNRVGEDDKDCPIGLFTYIDGSKTTTLTAEEKVIKNKLDIGRFTITKIIETLSLTSSIGEIARGDYNEIIMHPDVRKRRINRQALSAWCVYNATKMKNLGTTIKEICASICLQQKKFNTVRSVVKRLKDYNVKSFRNGSNTSNSNIQRYVSQMNIPHSIGKVAESIFNKLSRYDHRPATIAGAAIYIATENSKEYSRSFDEIGLITMMSGKTISNLVSKIKSDKILSDLKA